MATGKKGKKTKGKTVDLSTFLQDTPGPLPTATIRKNWADEVEDSYDGSYEPRSKANIVLPTAPKASRDYEDISDKVPKDPPYMAYLSNLPYDVDEEEIALLFKNMKIAKMTIPRDERQGEFSKLKGFGYVEFADRDSLINALVIPDTTLKSRRIRIEVAANSENDKRRGRMDMNRGQEKFDTFDSDWRAPRGGNQDSQEPERKSYRDNRDRHMDNRDRDRDREHDGAWRDEERPNRESERDRGFTRAREYDGGERGGGRYGDRRGFNDRRGFGDRDRGYGDRNRDDDSNRNEPRQRTKLKLNPRTIPVEKAAPVESVPSASIFGNAKPVDTTIRERQIEERLAKEHVKPREPSKERQSGPPPDDEIRRNERNDRREISRRENDSPNFDRPNSQNKRHEEDRRPPPRSEPTRHTEERRNDKPPRREEKRDKSDKEMPKFKEPEAPNFAQNNKFAYLQDENSD